MQRVIPIRVEPVETFIEADRRLAFEVVSAFRSTRAPSDAAWKLIAQNEHRLLVDFYTEIAIWRRFRRTIITREWVSLSEPDQIDFVLAQPAKGLQMLEDRFVFEEHDGGTTFRYESTFGVRGSILGWFAGKAVIQPLLRRHMLEHVAALKETIETRARRSRLYPRPERESEYPGELPASGSGAETSPAGQSHAT